MTKSPKIGKSNVNRGHGGGAFSRNVFTLVSGNVVAQVITLILVPIITRLYAPSVFGEFATVMGIAAVLTAISSFRYSAAVFLPSSEMDTVAVVMLGLTLVAIFTSLLFVVLLFTWDVVVIGVRLDFAFTFMGYSNQRFFGGMQLPLEAWSVRRKEFKRLAIPK